MTLTDRRLYAAAVDHAHLTICLVLYPLTAVLVAVGLAL